MYAKIQITGIIEVVTGMHIGGSSAFAAIGAVDSPVIKDSQSGLSIIPGSSLKGKMRFLLAKQYNEKLAKTPDDDHELILRLFGSSKKNQFKRGKLLFSDSLLMNDQDLREHTTHGQTTEVKFENTIDRITATANPRQIERVIRGAKFPLDLMYEISGEGFDESELLEDFQTLADGLKLLQYDYLGGSGSRGYGKIRFKDFDVAVVAGDSDESIDACEEQIDACKEILQSAIIFPRD